MLWGLLQSQAVFILSHFCMAKMAARCGIAETGAERAYLLKMRMG